MNKKIIGLIVVLLIVIGIITIYRKSDSISPGQIQDTVATEDGWGVFTYEKDGYSLEYPPYATAEVLRWDDGIEQVSITYAPGLKDHIPQSVDCGYMIKSNEGEFRIDAKVYDIEKWDQWFYIQDVKTKMLDGRSVQYVTSGGMCGESIIFLYPSKDNDSFLQLSLDSNYTNPDINRILSSVVFK